MKVSAEKIENQQVVLTIEVPAAELDTAVKNAVKRIANKVNIHGFRRGKAPRQVIERSVGKKAILDEAFEMLAPRAFSDALTEQDITPVTRPNIEVMTLEEGKDVVFKATVTPRPEVKLGEYKGLKAEKKVAEVKDEDVDHQIEHMLKANGKMVEDEAGAKVADGSFITLDFKGFVNDEAFEGGEAKDYLLQIGSKSFIPGFEDQLIGAAVDEEREVNVTFPEDYHVKELAGKPAVFKCVVHSIKHKELPELNDEFVQKETSFKTVAELKADIRSKMEANAEQEAEIARRREIIEQATKNTTVDIPQVMIDERVSAMIREMAMRFEQQGMEFGQYLQYAGKDIAKLREEYKETAAENVKTDLMLEEVAKQEQIKVTADDLDAEVAMLARNYNATVEQVRKIIKEQGHLNSLADTVLRRKTAQFIVDNVAE